MLYKYNIIRDERRYYNFVRCNENILLKTMANCQDILKSLPDKSPKDNSDTKFDYTKL